MSLKSQVLRCYRQLLRTRLELFAGDIEALEKSRMRLREAFVAQKHLMNSGEILEQIKIAEETNEFLKQGVLQAAYATNQDIYKVKIRNTTKLHNNTQLKEANIIDLKNFKVPEKYKSKS